ncbi:peptide chain release factor N(5)-glutamine methyltransferase [Brachybacterium timonense]|uniref:peptide chain release factor N(5)-glutamine methyltransferase n=1 Tax=Brachybacterium timonense TaxID=2050896 RepID=UPI001482E74C|nr:peptide chain release factor N(5)-glutamine methyltransferase [Brachybacterium timonense]
MTCADHVAPGCRDADPQRRLRRALQHTARVLADVSASPAAESRALVTEAAEAEGHLLLVDSLPDDFDARLAQMVSRRLHREPLQLILGRAPFRRLELAVEPGVFIPRPETELLVDLLLQQMPDAALVVDLCTGSGAVAAAVLDELPGARVIAVERDPHAANLARRNLHRIAGSERWELRIADVRAEAELTDIDGADAVLSNPPYIPPGAVPREVEVREHDPERALYGGGEDGLEVPTAVLARASTMLRPGGLLAVEHADVQGAAMRELTRATGAFNRVRTVRDLAGRDRFVMAHRQMDTSDRTEVRD